MVTLIELIDSTTWLQPQDHMEVHLWDKSKIGEEDEFKDIELNIRNLAKYGNYIINELDIDYNKDGEPILFCYICKE